MAHRPTVTREGSGSVSIGGRLTAMRRAAGLSQAALAVRSGVPQSEISRIERGRTTPSLTRVERLAAAMGGRVELVGPPVRTGRSVRERHPTEPAWDDVIAAAVRLQTLLPDATLVGGTAAGLHAAHRRSFDADHVLVDLRDRFEAVLSELEAVVGWRTARVVRPVMVLGSLDGIETGVRQLRRTEPLETEPLETAYGPLTLPTRAEILRIKAYLILIRNATRDYLDFAALYAGMAEDNALASLASLDRLYPQDADPGAVRQQLLRQLAEPAPWDLDTTSVAEYKGIVPPWTDWDTVVAACRTASDAMIDAITDARPGWQDVAGP
ncbi:MAG: helix-turn-helix domain-containing protein [Chloroflexota bacterium]|nr:helix-turn-helix domain-containing protein [Chloroflexota bacterium]